MKIRAIALNTFAGLVRNKLLFLFFIVFLCVLLLMMSPLLVMKTNAARSNADTFQSQILTFVSFAMTLLSGFGSLLAAWSAAESVAGEIRSGTILAVLARPVKRWEFLLGKYLGVQILMVIYVAFMFGMSYLLAWIGGATIHSTPWVLIAYPLIRYAVYSAIAMLLGVRMHPVFAFAIVLVISVLAGMVTPDSGGFLPQALKSVLFVVLPSTNLLGETRFLTITQATLKPIPWSDHATALAYGLDYALVCFLLAIRAFRTRSLTRD